MGKTKAYFLVFIQMACIAVLILNSWHFYHDKFALVIFVLGFVLGIVAIYTMSKSRIKISPIPHKNARLMTHGAYNVIRHPMYTAVLLCCLAFCLGEPKIWKWLVYLVLVVTLLVKLHFEEGLLVEKFPDYSTYQKRTKKLIPFIY